MLKEKFKDPQSQRMLSVLESSAKRGAEMVKQVLTFARGVEGERVLLQPRHLIKEVAKILGDALPKTIQLRSKLPENLWPLMGDATQCTRCSSISRSTARDAMPEGGIVTLSAENAVIDAATQEQISSEAKPGFYVVISGR